MEVFDIANPRFNEQISPAPWHFVKSRLHCRRQSSGRTSITTQKRAQQTTNFWDCICCLTFKSHLWLNFPLTTSCRLDCSIQSFNAGLCHFMQHNICPHTTHTCLKISTLNLWVLWKLGRCDRRDKRDKHFSFLGVSKVQVIKCAPIITRCCKQRKKKEKGRFIK